MNEQEQRIAIAEACGWAIAHNCKNVDQPEAINVYKPMIIDGSRMGQTIALLPDYCNDLNAMHEAEKAARVHLGQTYAKNLREVIDQDKRRNILRHETWVYYTATAAQRAEAFLKTIGKWEESK